MTSKGAQRVRLALCSLLMLLLLLLRAAAASAASTMAPGGWRLGVEDSWNFDPRRLWRGARATAVQL